MGTSGSNNVSGVLTSSCQLSREPGPVASVCLEGSSSEVYYTL